MRRSNGKIKKIKLNHLTKTHMNSEIKNFLKQVLADGGQTGLAPAVEETMLEDLNNRLEDRLILTAMQKLSLEKQKELEKITLDKTADNAPQIEEFLKNNIPDYEQVFTQALIDFRNTYVEANKG